MNLTQAQQLKWQNYLTKIGGKLPSQSLTHPKELLLEEHTNQLPQDVEETIIEWCQNDIFQKLPKDTKLTTNKNIIEEILTKKTLNLFFEELENFEDKLFVAAIRESQEIEEIMLKISTQSIYDKETRMVLLNSIIFAYIEACLELNIQANLNILLLTK